MSAKGCLKIFAWCMAALALVVLGLFVLFIAWPVWGWGSNGERWAGPVPLTPAWALEPWVWEDDVNTAEFTLELLADYEKHDFPIRTILIDSPWTTRYNDFQVDEERFPNPEEFFTGLQDRGYRVVLWMTNNVNSESKDTAIQDSIDWFLEAKEKGYLALNGEETRWWKGKGGFIDYTNPEAMQWWRGLQQPLFDWGIDGWKLDGTGTYFHSMKGPIPVPWGDAHERSLSMRAYMDHYYRDEYQHGLTQNPEFITLSRSVDDQIPHVHKNGFAPLDASPVNWVGDQDHAWAEDDEGIEEALRDILRSAELGYSIVGSDVAGYSGGEIPPNVYIRWAQFSAFCGLFLNGGHGERRMSERTPQELEIVREYAWLHTELIPYIYSYMVLQHGGGPTLMQPQPAGSYHYLFGPDLLVAPIHEDSTVRAVTLPEGRWRYFFDTRQVYDGPATITGDFPMDEFPVYVREGAIIPMDIKRAYTGIGDRDWEGWLTLKIVPAADASRMDLHPPDGGAALRIAQKRNEDNCEISFEHGRNYTGVILVVHLDNAPDAVEFGGDSHAAGEVWTWDDARGVAVVRIPKESGATACRLRW